MESISFTIVFINKKNHVHIATSNSRLKDVYQIFHQLAVKRQEEQGPGFMLGKLPNNLGWEPSRYPEKFNFVVRERGKHGPTFEININRIIIKCRIVGRY